MTATVAGILLYGDHASRPAASAPPVGSLYSCSDHGLVYVTDGATWATWATLGGSLVAAGTGDMSASAPGDTVAAGASGKYSDGGHRHARESYATITAGLDYGESGDISASAPGDTAAAGATGEVADAGHRHPRLGEACAIEVVIDGGGSAITTGVKMYLMVPFSMTITSVEQLADQSGSIVTDIWQDTYANYPPTNADSICASAKPTISSATKSQDATLTGWTTGLVAGRCIGINVDSATTVTRVTLALRGVRA